MQTWQASLLALGEGLSVSDRTHLRWAEPKFGSQDTALVSIYPIFACISTCYNIKNK